MNDENVPPPSMSQMGQGRKPLVDLTNIAKRPPPPPPPTKVPRRPASAEESSASNASELKLVRKLLQEREKQVVQLTQQLSISDTRSEELLQENTTHKRVLLESRRQLSEKETTLRKKSVALTSTSKLLHAFVNRKDQKVRRSQMERLELEAELERLESDFEQQLASMNDARLMLEEAASKRETEQYSKKISELTTIIAGMGTKTSELSFENTLLKEQQDEWKKTEATLQSTCSSQQSQLEDLTSRLNRATSATIDLQRSQELSEEITRGQEQQQLNPRWKLLECFCPNHDPLKPTVNETIEQLNNELDVLRHQLSNANDEIERHREGTKISTTSSSELWNSIRLLKQTESLLQREVQSLQHQLTITREEVKQKLEELEVATMNHARLEGAMVLEVNRKIHLEALHDHAEEQLMTARDEYRTLHGLYSKLKTEHLGIVKQLAIERETISVLTVDQDVCQQQQQQALMEYSELQHMHNLLKTSAQQNEIQISVLQSVIDVQNQGLADVRQKYDSFRGETGTIEQTNKQLQQDLTHLLMENTRQQKELLDLQQQQVHVTTLTKELQSCRDGLTTKTHELSASKISMARLESQLRTEEAKVMELMKQREDSFQQVNRQDKLHMLDSLKQQIQELVNDNRRLRKDIEKLESNRGHDV